MLSYILMFIAITINLVYYSTKRLGFNIFFDGQLIAALLLLFIFIVFISERRFIFKKCKGYTRKNKSGWFEFLLSLFFNISYFTTLIINLNNHSYEVLLYLVLAQILLFFSYELFMMLYTSFVLMSNQEKFSSLSKCNKTLLLLVLFNILASHLDAGFYNNLIINSLLIWKIILTLILFLLISYCLSLVMIVNANMNNRIILLKILLSSLLICVFGVKVIYAWFNSTEGNSILSIIAGVVGGVLTLVGVTWTIKREEQIRKSDEKGKCKPYLRLIRSSNTDENNMTSRSIDDLESNNKVITKILKPYNSESSSSIIDSPEKGSLFTIEKCVIKNTENAICVIRGLIINNNLIKFNNTFLLEKEEYFELFGTNIWFSTNNSINSMKIMIEDIIGNQYFSELIYNQKSIRIQRRDRNGDLHVEAGNCLNISDVSLPQDYIM